MLLAAHFDNFDLGHDWRFFDQGLSESGPGLGRDEQGRAMGCLRGKKQACDMQACHERSQRPLIPTTDGYPVDMGLRFSLPGV